MIESVVALLMFVNAEIKEARLQTEGMAQCLRGHLILNSVFSVKSLDISSTCVLSLFWVSMIPK